MKKNSPFQIALLATFAALAVASVLIFSFFISKGSSSSIGSVTVWGTFDEPTMQKALADLSDTNHDLQNVHYVQKDASTYLTDITNALASGQAPDLFFLSQEDVYSQKDRIVPYPLSSLAPSVFDSTFIDGAQTFMSPDGTLALPVFADPLVMYWNKDMLAAAGFSQPPQYWDELSDFTQKITQRSDDGTLTASALSFGTYSNVDYAKEILSMLIMQAGGSVTLRDASGNLNSGLLAKNRGATELAAVPSALRFYTEFADASKPDYTWNRSFPNSQKAFTSGNLALYIGHASEIDALRQANPNLNFTFAPVPQVRGVPTEIDGGIVYGVAMPKAARNKIGGQAIQALLASADISSALSTALGYPSARRDVLDKLRQQGSTRVVATETIIVRTWTDPDPQKTDAIFRAMIEDTTSGALLLSEAISRAEQQLNNLIHL